MRNPRHAQARMSRYAQSAPILVGRLMLARCVIGWCGSRHVVPARGVARWAYRLPSSSSDVVRTRWGLHHLLRLDYIDDRRLCRSDRGRRPCQSPRDTSRRGSATYVQPAADQVRYLVTLWQRAFRPDGFVDTDAVRVRRWKASWHSPQAHAMPEGWIAAHRSRGCEGNCSCERRVGLRVQSPTLCRNLRVYPTFAGCARHA